MRQIRGHISPGKYFLILELIRSLDLACIQAVEEAERKAREEAELKVKEEEERKAKEELEKKAAEAANSATGQVRASISKDTPEATVKLLNSFPVENGPAQRMSYLMEVHILSLPLKVPFNASSPPR